MSDKTKMLLIFMVPPFVFGFVNGLFDIQDFGMYLILLLITILIIAFCHKKFISKSFKNDEINRKMSVMSDAVGARVGLIVMLVILMTDHFGFSVTEKIGLEKEIHLLFFCAFIYGNRFHDCKYILFSSSGQASIIF